MTADLKDEIIRISKRIVAAWEATEGQKPTKLHQPVRAYWVSLSGWYLTLFREQQVTHYHVVPKVHGEYEFVRLDSTVTPSEFNILRGA